MKSLINYRDQGCQGAFDILQKVLSLCSSNTTLELQKHNANRIVFYIENSLLNEDIIKIKEYKISIYQQIAKNLGIEFLQIDTIEAITSNDIVIIDKKLENCLAELKNKEIIACLLEEFESDFCSSSAISIFTLFAYTAIRNSKKIEDISINWIGDAGTKYELLTKSLLNATVCNKNYLAYAFEDNKEESLICAPHADNLDFAMSAAAKVFLTHDAGFLEEDADIVYITHWTHKKTAGLSVKHPFAYEAINQDYTDKTQIISLINDIKSSSIDEVLYNKVALNTRLVALTYLITK